MTLNNPPRLKAEVILFGQSYMSILSVQATESIVKHIEGAFFNRTEFDRIDQLYLVPQASA